MARLLLVSNRLPVTVKHERGAFNVQPSSGGLASGLRGPHASSNGLWIGWPGDTAKLSADQLAALDQKLAALRTVPLHLTSAEVSRYYEGFSNRVVWPLFHYLVDRLPLHPKDWASYRSVNQRFADRVVESYQPGDTIWVHDYQLMLVPGMLREKLPHARIGFFLHIPFPSLDVFRVMPWRREIMTGLVGADLVGFHTENDAQHFRDAAKALLGREDVTVGAFPMGVDVDDFETRARAPETDAAVQELLRSAPGERLLVGIDRLDYTKGLRHRMLAMERLLQQRPALRGKIRLIQVAVPSRTNVDAYAEFRRNVDEQVGRINGTYGTPTSVPIHYLFRSISPTQLSALYRAADVMVITPLRDGMNLVAKEFVASRVDDDGVLMLSEFAGASAELREAIQVNPYDIDGVARSLDQALSLPREERCWRMQALRKQVRDHDVNRWVSGFLGALEQPQEKAKPIPSVAAPPSPLPRAVSGVNELRPLLSALIAAPQRILMLDYDGTIVPLAARPELAQPSEALMQLLGALTLLPNTHVNIVSGRPCEFLESRFGHLPIGLHAEHGLWTRPEGAADWHMTRPVDHQWMNPLRTLLEQFARETPGAFVEEKSASLAWHYRQADQALALTTLESLRRELALRLRGLPVSVLEGNHVLELRPRGIHKGNIVAATIASRVMGGLIFAAGDDRTDEDLFQALPPDAIALHVGESASVARYPGFHTGGTAGSPPGGGGCPCRSVGSLTVLKVNLRA